MNTLLPNLGIYQTTIVEEVLKGGYLKLTGVEHHTRLNSKQCTLSERCSFNRLIHLCVDSYAIMNVHILGFVDI